MMKLQCVFLSVIILFMMLPAEETALMSEGLDLGSIKFPRAFIHAGKNYNSGIYKVVLNEKVSDLFFTASNTAGEFLFNEVAIVKNGKNRLGSRKFLLRSRILRGYEYFRIRVLLPDKTVMGYFLLGVKTDTVETETPAEE